MNDEDDGKIVHCLASTPDTPGPQSVSRAVCLHRLRPECPICPHSTFVVRLQVGIGNQEVACPRWEEIRDYHYGRAPDHYVFIRRETCLTAQPFVWCASCPNRKPDQPARKDLGWWDLEPSQQNKGAFEEDDG